MKTNKTNFVKLGLPIAILTLVASAVNASTLTEADVYRRCYVRLTRDIPRSDDSRLIAVQQGQKTSQAACLELLDLAQLGTDGVLVRRNDPVAQRVLKTFHDVHQSWFQVKKYGIQFETSSVVRDAEEQALYFTRAAFLSGAQFKSIVTLNTGLRGIRVRPATGATNRFDAQRFFRYNSTFSFAGEKELLISYLSSIESGGKVPGNAHAVPYRVRADDLVDTGALIGVKTSLSIPLAGYVPFQRGNAELSALAIANANATTDVNAHFGGGVIGSQTFLLNNMNLGTFAIPNSYSLINRRATSRIFEDLLCHQLPSLSDEDVATEVVPTSDYTFHQSSSCMRCHSTIDGTAFAIRNLTTFQTSGIPASNGQTVGYPITGVTRLPAKANATTFALQAPEGRIHYREITSGTKVSRTVSSTSEIGAVLAAGEDLYTCAARRYYYFFTGIKVDLNYPANNDLDRSHQDLVKQLGRNLKRHQSVRTLLSEIFGSSVFKTRDYQTARDK